MIQTDATPTIEAGGLQAPDDLVETAEQTGSLPPHHRDPFDRMLVAQAQAESLIIVTRDERLGLYGVETLPA